jgi:hypothetical protein
MATTTTARPTARAPDTLEALLQQVLEGQRALDVKVDALLARLAPGPRDAGDVALVRVIAAGAGGKRFTAASVWRRRAAGDNPLADALATADIESPKQLGKLLRRLGARNVSGIYLDRVGANREGTIWCARVQE